MSDKEKTNEEKMQDLVVAATNKYEGNKAAQNMIAAGVRSAIAEAQANKIPIDVEKPEGGYSFQELVDIAVSNFEEAIQGATPKPEPPKPEPDPPPKEDKTPEPQPDPPPTGDVLPSGAKVPEGIDPSEVVQVDITNPVTLEDTQKVVEARKRLKSKMQTSTQQDATNKALEQIITEINAENKEAQGN